MALKYLAEQAGCPLRPGNGAQPPPKDIADAYHIPPQLLAKILQTLTKGGLLISTAGTNGGYSLARPASEISAFEVIRTIDGPLFITSCITIHGTCDLDSHCTIKEPLRKVNDSIKDLLSGIRIADLIEASSPDATPGPSPGQSHRIPSSRRRLFSSLSRFCFTKRFTSYAPPISSVPHTTRGFRSF